MRKKKFPASRPILLTGVEVRDFFAARKINEEDFQKQVAEISHDDLAWRDFLSKSMAVLDSIKAARAAQH